MEVLIGRTSRAENVFHAADQGLHCIRRASVIQLGKRPQCLSHVTRAEAVNPRHNLCPCRLQELWRSCLQLCKRPQDIA